MATRTVRIADEDTADVFEVDAWDGYVQLAVTEGYLNTNGAPDTVQASLSGSSARKLAAMLIHLADIADQQPR